MTNHTYTSTHALCGACQQWLPHHHFSPRSDPRYHRPVRSHCRPCETAKVIARHQREPEKPRARVALHRAVAKGVIRKGPCETCGTTTAVQGHHFDYTRPLYVQWLCPKCHAAVTYAEAK